MHIFGYIDPGTGSLFLQAIIGVILGGIVVFRNTLGKIVRKFRTLFSGKKDTSNDTADE